jgi:tight adherence protein B
MLLPVAVFVLILAIVLGSYWVFVIRAEQSEERAVRQRLTNGSSKAHKPMLVNEGVRQSSLAVLDALLPRWESTLLPLKRTLDRSGIKMTIGAVLLSCVFSAMGGLLVVFTLTSSWAAAIGAAVVLSSLPVIWVRRAARKRLNLFEEQFPEAIDLMARSLRAGHALTTALQMVGEEIPDPIGSEFRLLFDRQNFGMSLPEALREFAVRVPLLDARFFVTALLTQRETGGNLSEVLDNLSSVIRERFKVKRQVRVMSAQGRLTGIVLGFLPPVLAGILMIISPQHMRMLVDDPLGDRMIVAAIVLQVIGILAIRRIVNVEY